MLTIRAAQMAVLADDVVAKFDESLAEHLRHFATRETQVLGRDGLRSVVRLGRKRAAQCEFTDRESLRLYVELMVLLGSGFATDPQYPWAAAALALGGEPRNQWQRASALQVSAVEYAHTVLGAKREFVLAALERLVGYRLRDFLGTKLFPESLIQQLRVIFPEKWAYVGRDRLRTLMQSARKMAEQYALLAEEAVALFTVLLFFLGHEVDRDPTAPWVEATLREAALMEPLARIEQLESRTWAELRAVLVANQGRRNHGLG
jgi:hypothetical protein